MMQLVVVRHSLCTAFFVVLLLSGVHGGEGATSFAPKPRVSTVTRHANWMSRVPDESLISQISIPGTHDTCARHNGFSFGFAKCQAWSLSDQLDAGIRFVDIRCRHINNEFHIYHGVVDQRQTFEEVLRACHKFLKAHPSECIVMSVKEEAEPKGNSRSFSETFKHAIDEHQDLWLIGREIPKLHAARGRIILVDRVGTLGGVRWQTLDRQDRFDVPIETKLPLIQSHFEKSRKSKPQQWFINFCSGTVPHELMTPPKYAQETNLAAQKYLQRSVGDYPIRLGIVVMDFPGEDLVELIVASNLPRKESQ